MKFHFVWIGKTRDRNYAALTADYLKRIERFAAVEVSELKEQPTGGGDQRVIAGESARLLAAVERDDYVVLLDEGGRQSSSLELSEAIGRHQQNGIKRLAFVIGGFAGVNDEVKRRADLQLALSKMTLPHELARVVLTEQIYRALSLLGGLPYHKF